MRSIGLWPWFKDQGLVSIDMPFSVCSLPRVMPILQSDISAKRKPAPCFRLKINAPYLEQKCVALIIEACGNPRSKYLGCQQCLSLGLECINADGLGAAAENAAQRACARCLFNEKSWMGVGTTCSLRDQHATGPLAPQPSQTTENSTFQKIYAAPARQYLPQATGPSSSDKLSTTISPSTATTNQTTYTSAPASQSPLPTIPQKRQATAVPIPSTQSPASQHEPQRIQTEQRLHGVNGPTEYQNHPDQAVSHGHVVGPRLADPSRQSEHQDLTRIVIQQAPGAVGPPAVNTSSLAQQTPGPARQYAWQPPVPPPQQGAPFHDVAARPVKRKRGRPPKDRTFASRPPMQVWVGNVSIEYYSDHQLAVGISVFTAELNRRRHGTPYPAHFHPKRTIYTPAMPAAASEESQPWQDPQMHPQDGFQATATNPLPAVSGSGPQPHWTNVQRPPLVSGVLPEAPQSNATSADYSRSMNLPVARGPDPPSATSQLISPPPSGPPSGPRYSPESLDPARTSRPTAPANDTTHLQQENVARTSTESSTMANSSTPAPTRQPNPSETDPAGRETGDMAEPTPAGVVPWGQVSRSPSEAAPVRPSADAAQEPAMSVKSEPGRSPDAGVPIAQPPANIATAALSLWTSLAKNNEGGDSDQPELPTVVKIESDK